MKTHWSTVTIVQRILPHYRIPFFRKLAEELLKSRIELQLIYGQESRSAVPVSVPINDSWAYRIRNIYLHLPKVELVWQPCLSRLSGSDLIVVEQSNRLLINYLLLAKLINRQGRLAYWGHGRNMQARQPDRWREKIKRKFADKVDWWFAYTKMSTDIIIAAGFDAAKMTTVENTIDTQVFADHLANITLEQLKNIKATLQIKSENICLYCGGMYPEKEIDFLISACIRIREIIPDFHMIVVGSGPDQYKVEQAARSYPWLCYVGAKYGKELAPYFSLAKAFLLPGLVGLAIIDSFVAQVPLVTTNITTHSPEIAFLKNNNNGIITAFALEDYVNAVCELLRSDAYLRTLQAGCAHSAQRYTLTRMVNNFADGVRRCLSI